MKKLFLCSAVFVLILSCNHESKTDTSSSDKTDTKALYEKNLATLKSTISAFEKEDMEGWASYIADTAFFGSPMYGDTNTTKAHWKEMLSSFVADWDNLKLNNPNFLPGIDSATHEFDGSVRYYGQWSGVHKSGVKTNVNFYGSYDFNKDDKIVAAYEFFDVGGVMNAVKPK